MRLKTLTCICLAALLSACSSVGDNADNGMAPLSQYQPEVLPNVIWAYNVTSGSDDDYLKFQPALSRGRLFSVDNQGALVAVDAQTGNQLWSVKNKQALISSPAVVADKVVVNTAEAEVHAYAQRTGKLIWRSEIPNQALARPVIAGDKILIKTVDSKLIALSADTGKQLWRYDHGSTEMVLRGSSTPQVFANFVLAGFANGKLVAVDTNTGKLLWERTIARPRGGSIVEQMVDIDADPIVNNGIVYVATYQGKLVAVDLRSDKVLWQHDISSYSGMALGDNRLYITDADGMVWAFDEDIGSVVWKQDKLKGRGLTAPVVMGNSLVVGDAAGYVHWLSLSGGKQLGRVFIDKSGIIAPPVVSHNKLYVTAKDGKVALIRERRPSIAKTAKIVA